MTTVMISSYFLIPASLIHDCVIPLLEISDLVQLDTAVLNHKARGLFLEQLEGARLATESIQVDNHVAQWLLNRNISITSLHVSQKATDLTMVEQLASSVNTLVTIENCNKLNEAAVTDFIRACMNVKSFCVLGLYNGSNILELISQSCSALQCLNLYCWVLEIENLTALTMGCKLLTTLILNRCYWMNDGFSAIIAQNCPQLQKLSLDSCNKCGDRSLQMLAQHCHDLRYLSMCGVNPLTDAGMHALAAGCAELRTFLADENRYITTHGIVTLAQGCTKLEDIGIPKCDKQIDLSVAALVQHCPALNTLRCWSTHLTDQSLQHLKNCPLLHTLEIKGSFISTPALMQLLDCSVNLQHLISNRRQLCENPVGLVLNRKLHKLVRINFEHSSSLTDAEFITLIAQCPGLSELDLNWCSGLTEAAVLAVAAYCKMLQNIKLNSDSISDTVICELAKNCSFLHTLLICNAAFLTDTAASAIAEHCPCLKHLDMSFCVKITDAGIVEILQKCRQLRVLELKGCHLITHAVLNAVVRYGARLRKLDLIGCYLVREYAVAAFCDAMPNCKLEEM